ncbi:long-chain fatty acid-CoA ligase [Emmonsiellopsis sp. PD_33]|nr:long-chain fatty acid-CoA ligase [Emmonsiellopsis sp. PD_33]
MAPSKNPPYTVNAPGYEPVDGETIPRRNARFKDHLLSRPDPAINTVWDVVIHGARKFGSANCMGSRELLQEHVDSKKVKKIVDGEEVEVDKQWTFFELGPYSYITYVEYEQLALHIGAGLRKLGFAKGDRLHLYASTRYCIPPPSTLLQPSNTLSPRWLASMHGAVSQSMSVVTSYETLGEDGLRHSMLETKARAIYTEPHLLKSLTTLLPDTKDVKLVIYNNTRQLQEDVLSAAKVAHPDITFLSFEDLRKLGEENPTDPVPPDPEDLACIMYTSGSTGPPKGVPLKHKHVVAAVAGVNSIVGDHISSSDIMLTYLPLAHIFEFVFEHAALFWGALMGYGNPKTLSDLSMRNCKGDIRELRPTLMVGVPAVWETVRKGVIAKVEQAGLVSKKLFWAAFYLKRQLISRRLAGTGILDWVVFKKISDATGGRLRFTMNGAGPIARETQEFISLVIAPMVIGYGLTETGAMTSVSDPWAWPNPTLGDLPACIEVKLVDFPDAGYYTKNTPPQGEVWIRGNSVMEGYYNREDLTDEVITADGWFKTGDIGEWDQNGHLKVIDRKKSLVKTQNGEYIALEKLESVYASVGVVANICVYAAADRAKPMALVVPAEPALEKLARENGIKGQGLEGLAHDKRLRRIVLQDMQSVGRKAGLTGLEIIEAVVLVDEPWTPQNGLTTATGKLNRRGITDKYKTEIEEAYGKQ